MESLLTCLRDNPGSQAYGVTSILRCLCLTLLLTTAAAPSKGTAQQYLTLKAAKSAATPQPELVDLYHLSLYPQVINNSITNVTGQLGASVFLPCKTQHSLERQVSWVRRRDWHILTSGLASYTKEQRFGVHHPEGSTEWTLAIKYLKLEDEGTYECQISGGAGMVSQLAQLSVVVPQAVIPGNGEYHVDTGSTIALTCFIDESTVAPQFIFWYHNSRMINYDRERGGISVTIETQTRVRSRLTVTNARPADSGNYTCAAENTAPASITVYITQGNQIAAIQPRAVDEGTSLHCYHLTVAASCILPCFMTHYFLHGFRRVLLGDLRTTPPD